MRDASEKVLVSYICTSIRSSYIKRLHNFVPYSALSDRQLYYVEAASTVYYGPDSSIFHDLLNRFPPAGSFQVK